MRIDRVNASVIYLKSSVIKIMDKYEIKQGDIS